MADRGEKAVHEKLLKLVEVKSIVTLMLSTVFSVLAVKNDISAEQFLTVFTTVIAFYFGTQAEKNKTERSINNEKDS